MSDLYPKPKQESEPGRRRSRLVRAGAGLTSLGLVGALIAGCGFSSDTAKDVANASAVGQALVADGYTLVDVNGAGLVQRAARVSFPTDARGSNIEYLEYRRCDGKPLFVYNRR